MEKAAYIMAASTSAMIECEAFKAANRKAELAGDPLEYPATSFWALQNRLEETVAEISRS